jgi:FkbM family methyltransferase
MVEKNLIITLIEHSIKIFKKEGTRGYLLAIKNYYNSYPALHKVLYYWLFSKFHRRKIIIRNIQGSKMMLNLNDFGLSKQLFLNGIREPECTRIMKKILKKDMIIAEIGANIGYYTLIEASSIGKNGKIYAIEPFPSNFELLKKNIELNSYNKITELFNIAISNKTDVTKLYIDNKHNLCNMFESDIKKEFVKVKTKTFDDFIADKKIPDLIRMDIEGFEYYVIEGMKKTLEKCSSCKIFIELHPFQMEQKGLDYEKPIKTLFQYGFQPIYIIKEYGPMKEECFKYNLPTKTFFMFLKEKQLLPPSNTHGFGLFLEKR